MKIWFGRKFLTEIREPPVPPGDSDLKLYNLNNACKIFLEYYFKSFHAEIIVKLPEIAFVLKGMNAQNPTLSLNEYKIIYIRKLKIKSKPF